MPSTYELKQIFNAPSGSKGREVLNYIMRRHMPGFDAMLDVITRLHEAQHGRSRPDPMLQDMLDKLRAERDKMADAILAGRLENGVLEINPQQNLKISIHAPQGATQELPTPPPSAPSSPLGEKDQGDDRMAMLGTLPDTTLAAQWGVSHTTVAKMRRKRGIKPYAAAKARIDWSRWDAQLRVSPQDAEGLAALIGCDASTVRERMRFLRGAGGKYHHD